MSDHLAELLNDFGKLLGLEGLSPAEDDSWAVQFDDVVVQIDADRESGALICYVDLGRPPAWGAPTEFYEALLEANFFASGTGGASLGICREAGFIALSQRVPVNGTTPQELSAVIERLVDFAESWLRKMADLLAQKDATGSVSQEAGSALRV
ncbi:MAG TPA: type III secretion system chaperone [Caulifigura sp.]|jgi:hypothetical protein|nr:type III secretion system chaperone [Caulifigura sp.]